MRRSVLIIAYSYYIMYNMYMYNSYIIRPMLSFPKEILGGKGGYFKIEY